MATLQEKIEERLGDWVDEQLDTILDELEPKVHGLIRDEVNTVLDID